MPKKRHQKTAYEPTAWPEPAKTARFREARRHPEGKAFDLTTSLGDYDVKKQATWGKSERIYDEKYIVYVSRA